LGTSTRHADNAHRTEEQEKIHFCMATFQSIQNQWADLNQTLKRTDTNAVEAKYVGTRQHYEEHCSWKHIFIISFRAIG